MNVCGYCFGIVIDNPNGPGFVHESDGQRVAVSGPGDFVSAAHNRAGSRVNPVDIIETVTDVTVEREGSRYEGQLVMSDEHEVVVLVTGHLSGPERTTDDGASLIGAAVEVPRAELVGKCECGNPFRLCHPDA